MLIILSIPNALIGYYNIPVSVTGCIKYS